jgi:gliding motility-associated-like protein
MRVFFTISVLFLISLTVFSQQSKHGVKTITTLNAKVNEYSTLTSNALVGNTSISVANSDLNSNNRFPTSLQVGDLIMIIQMQGASIKTFATVLGQDSTYGEILDYNEAGNYEFAEVLSIPNINTINLSCGLTNNYSVTGKTQIVRAPRYSSLTINAGASLTGDVWTGAFGGILLVEVSGLTTINGTVTATSLGFRGGSLINNGNFGGTRFVDLGGGANEGAEKGESIAGSSNEYAALFGGQYCRGSVANGGGGGNSHGAGGGGGANAGNTNSWSGYGEINTAYTAIYDLEYPGRAAVVSSGGGRGGYSSSTANLNPTAIAPNNLLWDDDGRRTVGGFGGRPLKYTSGKLFLGGGGGAGHFSNLTGANTGGRGGRGGGLIYFINYKGISGTGLVVADGQNGATATGPYPGLLSSSYNGNDAAGGGGGGGTIIFNSSSTTTGITFKANGGNGGNQQIVKGGLAGAINEAEGTGGGGGGGYIAVSNGTPIQTALGAPSGTTNSNSMINFPPNGATNGADGLTNQAITLYTLSANPVTICVNSAATLTATSNNPGASFGWYTNNVGTNPIAVGAAFTSSVFTTAGTYTVYVALCPGIYRIPVIITVTGNPTLTASSQTICSGQTATLSVSGANTYTWNTGATNATISPSPLATTIYTVFGTTGTCSSSATASVTVISTATFGVNSPTICSGQTATLTANTATSYTWSTNQNNQSITVSPLITTVYTVSASFGAVCQVSKTSTVTVMPNPTITVNSPSICAGQTATLNALGASNYLWYDGSILSSNIVSPVTTNSYSLTGINNGCASTATVSVFVTPNPTVSANSVSICAGLTASLIGLGAASYTWEPLGVNAVGSSFTVAPVSSTVYSLVGSTNGCVSTATVSVNVGANLSIAVNNQTICFGQSATLNAVSSATNYSWSNGSLTHSTVVSPLVNTSYFVNGNFADCKGFSTVKVFVNATPILTSSNYTICSGESATLNALGANNYTWSTASNSTSIIVSPKVNTTYTIVGEKTSCTSSAKYNVDVLALPEVVTTSASICNGSSTTLTANGAKTYTWLPFGTSSNSISVNPVSNTNYLVIGSDGTCTNSATARVDVINNGTVTFNSATVCSGKNAVIGTNAIATSYLWNNGATTQSISVSPTVTTNYFLQYIIGSCIFTGSTVVSIIPSPVINAVDASICKGDKATLFANGADSYTWTPGSIVANSISVNPNVTTSYVVSGANNNGCTATTTLQVIVNTKPSLTITPQTNFVCANMPITLSASGAAVFDWNVDGVHYSNNQLTFKPLKTTTVVIIGSNGGCKTSTLATVNVYPINAAIKPETNYVEYPGSISFTNTSTNFTSILWDFGNGQTSSNYTSTSAFYENPGNYKVTLVATNTKGCTDTTVCNIEAGCGKGNIFIPNTFTPNNDGLNDTFKVFGGSCITNFNGTIFDGWGKELFEFKNISDVWDGKIKGVDVENGVYNYIFSYTLYNGKQFSKTGVITVTR